MIKNLIFQLFKTKTLAKIEKLFSVRKGVNSVCLDFLPPPLFYANRYGQFSCSVGQSFASRILFVPYLGHYYILTCRMFLVPLFRKNYMGDLRGVLWRPEGASDAGASIPSGARYTSDKYNNGEVLCPSFLPLSLSQHLARWGLFGWKLVMGWLRGRVGHVIKIAKSMFRMLTMEIILPLCKEIWRGSNFGDLLGHAGGE